MPEDLKIWEVTPEDKLKNISKAKLNLEERLEKWLENDISILSTDLLLIGRQVSTRVLTLWEIRSKSFIQLLCLKVKAQSSYNTRLNTGATPNSLVIKIL